MTSAESATRSILPDQAATTSAGAPEAASTRASSSGGVLGAVREQLGVPLDAEAEARGRVPQRPRRAVGARARTTRPAPSAVDGLVVEAVDLEPAAAGEPVQRRARGDVDGVRGLERLVRLAVLERR